MKKIGIIITVKDRWDYLWYLYQSLLRADLSGCIIVLVDDGSLEAKTIRLINDWFIPGVTTHKLFNNKNEGVQSALRKGIEKVFVDCDYFITLDGDTVVRPDFVAKIMELPEDSISTGFHCTVKTSDGSEKYATVMSTDKYHLKSSVVGINMCFNKDSYIKYVEPALLKKGNWDYEVCKLLQADQKYVYCVKESVVQHLGVNSTGYSFENSDIANDFYLIDLPNVTLIGIDTYNVDRIRFAVQQCTRFIRFGAVKILSSCYDEDVTYIDNIKDKTEYSLFCLRELHKYINTTHVMVIQHDGYVLNPFAWKDEFLNYDYIGAPWKWYGDSHRVGNGGFSIRSKRLMQITAEDTKIVPRNQGCHNFAEDHQICRLYREYLQSNYDIKFADEELADQFSAEYCMVKPGKNKYAFQFGFHGHRNIDYSDGYIKSPQIINYPKMQNIYGLITTSDADVLSTCIHEVNNKFNEGPIRITEVGIHAGHTAKFMRHVVLSLGRQIDYTGIDAQVDFKMGKPFSEAKFIIGYSSDVYNQVNDESQHMIFIDANHNLMCTATDFLLYKSKLKQGGLFVFHDTGKHIPPFKDYQHMGDRKNPDNYIACRKALTLLGLYDTPETRGFKLFIDKADEKFETGGITAFQKL